MSEITGTPFSSKVIMNSGVFENYYGQFVVNVDLHNNEWNNNNMSKAFYNSANIQRVTNINDNVTNMSECFRGDSTLVYIDSLPNSLQDMSYMCTSCFNFGTTLSIYSSIPIRTLY